MNRQMPALLKPFVMLTYVLLLAPLAIVIAVSFGASPTYQFPPTELSLKWYRGFFGNPEFVRAFFSVSLVLGFLAAVFASLLGVTAAIGLVRFRFRGREAGLVGLDPRLEEAAMSLGASRVQAFMKVALPLIQSSIISGFIFAFIISFSDINLALFIAGPNSTTLPVYIFNLLLFEGDPSVAAASTLQIVIVGLLIWLVQFLFRPRALL